MRKVLFSMFLLLNIFTVKQSRCIQFIVCQINSSGLSINDENVLQHAEIIFHHANFFCISSHKLFQLFEVFKNGLGWEHFSHYVKNFHVVAKNAFYSLENSKIDTLGMLE